MRTQKMEKAEKTEIKKKTAQKGKESSYELPEIPDYERAVLEKPQEFDFGDHVPRDKSKLDRPVTQVTNDALFSVHLSLLDCGCSRKCDFFNAILPECSVCLRIARTYANNTLAELNFEDHFQL